MWWVRPWDAHHRHEMRCVQPRPCSSLTLACTWAEGDGRFLHTLESWISLAHACRSRSAIGTCSTHGCSRPSMAYPYQTRQVARAIRRARLVVMPRPRLFLEHADQFNRTLLRFLKSVRST